jgi:hypothetical protein
MVIPILVFARFDPLYLATTFGGLLDLISSPTSR